jgi:hypothetical protein
LIVIFAATKPGRLAEQQLKEAQLLLLEHEKAAEYHQAIAEMCRKRIARLAPPTTTESKQ